MQVCSSSWGFTVSCSLGTKPDGETHTELSVLGDGFSGANLGRGTAMDYPIAYYKVYLYIYFT